MRSRDEISGLTVEAEEASDVATDEISSNHTEIDGEDWTEVRFKHVKWQC